VSKALLLIGSPKSNSVSGKLGQAMLAGLAARGWESQTLRLTGLLEAQEGRARLIGEFLGAEYGAVLELMTRLRPLVLELGLGSSRNAAIFRGLVDSGLLEALKGRDLGKASLLLAGHIPAELHSRIPEILDGLG